MRYDMIYVRIWYDMLTTLLYGSIYGKRGWTIVSSSSCNLIYFVLLGKIPFPIFRFLFLFRFLFRLWMAGFRTLKLEGIKMDFLQTTICEVSGNVSWTGKDDLEPGSVELHHLYPWKNEFKFRVSKAGYIEVSSKLTTSFIYYADHHV